MHIKRQIIFFGIILFLSLLFINSEDVFSQDPCPIGRIATLCDCGGASPSPSANAYCCEDALGNRVATLSPSDECRAATTTTTPTTPPATPAVITSIRVISPSSDQQVQVGRELEIRWEADGESPPTGVNILLFRRIGGEGGADTSMIPINTVVVRSHAGTNTFIWNVPSEGLAIGVEEYKIVVLDQINEIRGESGFFSFVREISGVVAEAEVCAPLNVNGILCPLSNLGIPVESCSNIAGNLFRYENCGNRNVEITYSFTAGFEGCEARNFRINKWDGTRWVPIAREQQITINAEQGTATLRTPFDGNGIYAVLAEINSVCRREFACPESNVIVGGVENSRIRQGETLSLLACNLLQTPLSVTFTGLTPENGVTISNAEEITIEVAANRPVESATLYVSYTFEGRASTILGSLPRKAGSPTVFSYTFPARTVLPLEYTYEVVVQDSNGNRASTRATVGMRTTRIVAAEAAVAPTTPLGFTFNQISLHSITENEQFFDVNDEGYLVSIRGSGIVYRFFLTLENEQSILFRGQENHGGIAGVLGLILQITRNRLIEAGSVVEIRHNNVPIEDLLNSQFIQDIVNNPSNSYNLELFVDGRPARFVSAEILPEEPNRPATARFTLRIQGVDRLVEDIILVTDSQPRGYLAPGTIVPPQPIGITSPITSEVNVQESQVKTITIRSELPFIFIYGHPQYGTMFTAIYKISFTQPGNLWVDSFSFIARRRESFADEPFGEPARLICDAPTFPTDLSPASIGTDVRLVVNRYYGPMIGTIIESIWDPVQNYNIAYLTIGDPSTSPIPTIPIAANRDYFLVVNTIDLRCWPSSPLSERAPFYFVDSWEANLKTTIDGGIRYNGQEENIREGLNLEINPATEYEDPVVQYVPPSAYEIPPMG